MNLFRSMYRRQHSSVGSLQFRTVIGMFVVMVLPLLLNAAPPNWWSYWGVIDPTLVPNDYAAVNQGQLKFIAQQAAAEMTAHLPGGINVPAGADLGVLLNTLGNPSASTNDYAAVNLGQLKATAKPFYELLIGVGYTNVYPWTGHEAAANDFAAANIGQVKNLFSFDLTAVTTANDVDGDGIPDWWERYYFPTTYGTSSFNVNARAARGDGLTILQAFQQGLNPNDFYNGQIPALTYVSGNNQTAVPGSFVSYPLIVQVSDAGGNPIQGAPITFSVQTGGGQLQLSSTGSPKTTVNILSDANGQAKVFFQAPSTTSTTCIVTATTMAGSRPILCPAFTETSSDGTGTPNPTPTDPNGPDDPDGPQTVPVQSYACIDISSSSTNGNDVTSVALDDQNNAAFFYYDDNNEVNIVTWANGTPTPTEPLSLTDSQNVETVTYQPVCVLPLGTLFGNAVYLSDVYNGTVFSSTGGSATAFAGTDPAVLNLDRPFYIEVVAATPSGTIGAFNIDADFDDGYINYNNQYTYFTQLAPCDDPTWYGFPAASKTVDEDFLPYAMNNQGWAIGVGDLAGCGIWNGQTVSRYPANSFLNSNDWPGAINDQNQIVVDGYDGNNNSTEGYLWENGTTTILVNHLPHSLQGQISNIQPHAISNQANPGTDATIYILANAQVNGAAATIVCTRDNDGNWSFAQIQQPNGTNINQYVSINSSGAIAALATVSNTTDGTAAGQSNRTNAQPTPNQGASPSSSTHAVVVYHPDISITIGYGPSVISRDAIEAQLKSIISSPVDTQGDVKTYIYPGTTSSGGKKNWIIQTSSTQSKFIQDLQQSVPYIAYVGHANSGAGFALKAADDGKGTPFDPGSVTSLGSFLSFRDGVTAINWPFMKLHYPNFGANAIAANQIANLPQNYTVPGKFTMYDYNNKPSNVRFPNDNNIPAGKTFQLYNAGKGINQFHMKRKGNPFLVVKTTNSGMPTLGYKIFFDAACYSLRDYSEVFNHGCFIGSTDELSTFTDAAGAPGAARVPTGFVEALINGGGATEILNKLKSYGYNDFAQSNN